MRDVISDSDVRLIRAHIRRKGVTRVAQGVYGLDPYAPYVTAYTKLHAARAKKVAERREEVLKLVEQGVTIISIAKRLRTTESTVDHDIRALKDTKRLPEGSPRGARHE
jgi:DNA-binding NarL/FixJ family response regulator